MFKNKLRNQKGETNLVANCIYMIVVAVAVALFYGHLSDIFEPLVQYIKNILNFA